MTRIPRLSASLASTPSPCVRRRCGLDHVTRCFSVFGAANDLAIQCV